MKALDIGFIKERAWNALGGCYWYAFRHTTCVAVVTAVANFLLSFLEEFLTSLVNFIFADGLERFKDFRYSQIARVLDFGVLIDRFGISGLCKIFLTGLAAVLLMLILVWAVNGVYNVFIGEPVNIGLSDTYLALREGVTSIDIAGGFINNYANAVKAFALKWLYIIIGYVLFFVPGVVLYYRYMMVQYILAENPHIKPQRALEISRAMMKGNKFRMFLLKLSLVGWMILGALLCGVGMLFVFPYVQMVETEAYCQLREQVIAEGIVELSELEGFKFN